jgi:hypothetical protein
MKLNSKYMRLVDVVFQFLFYKTSEQKKSKNENKVNVKM